MEILKTHSFSEIKPDHNWKSRGQYHSLYYHLKPATYNQSQQYFHERRTQQAPSRNDYDSDKVVKHEEKYPFFH